MTSVAGNGVYPFPNKRYAKSSVEYQAAFGTDSDYVRRFDASLDAKTKAGRDTERSQQRQLIEDHVINTLEGMPEHSVFIWQDGLDSLIGNTFSSHGSPVRIWNIEEAIVFDRKIKQTCKEKGIIIESTQEGGYVRKNFAAAAGKYGPAHRFAGLKLKKGKPPRAIDITLVNGIPVKAAKVRAVPAISSSSARVVDGSKRKGGGGKATATTPMSAPKQAKKSVINRTELFLDKTEQEGRLQIFFTPNDMNEINSLISAALTRSPLPLFREEITAGLKHRTVLLDLAARIAETPNYSVVIDSQRFDGNATNTLLYRLGLWAMTISIGREKWSKLNSRAYPVLLSLAKQVKEIYKDVWELTFWIGVIAGNYTEVRLLLSETDPKKFIHRFGSILNLKKRGKKRVLMLKKMIKDEEAAQQAAQSLLATTGRLFFKPNPAVENLLRLRYLTWPS